MDCIATGPADSCGRRAFVLRNAGNVQADFFGPVAVNCDDVIIAPPVWIYIEIYFSWSEARLRQTGTIRWPIVPAAHAFAGVEHKDVSLGRIGSDVFERRRNHCHIAGHPRRKEELRVRVLANVCRSFTNKAVAVPGHYAFRACDEPPCVDT